MCRRMIRQPVMCRTNPKGQDAEVLATRQNLSVILFTRWVVRLLITFRVGSFLVRCEVRVALKSEHRSKKISSEIPKGYVWIGSLSSIKYRLVPRLAGSEVPVSASPLPRNIYTMSDESGIMGLTQGPFYVMSVSVVSNRNIYGKVVQRDSDGAFIKFNSAVYDVLDATLPELDRMLGGSRGDGRKSSGGFRG